MSWSYYDFLLIVGKGTLEIRSDWAAKNFNSSTVISGLFKSQTLNICFSCIGEYELFLINHAHNKGSYLLALGWEGKDIAFFFTVSRLLIYNFFFYCCSNFDWRQSDAWSGGIGWEKNHVSLWGKFFAGWVATNSSYMEEEWNGSRDRWRLFNILIFFHCYWLNKLSDFHTCVKQIFKSEYIPGNVTPMIIILLQTKVFFESLCLSICPSICLYIFRHDFVLGQHVLYSWRSCNMSVYKNVIKKC